MPGDAPSSVRLRRLRRTPLLRDITAETRLSARELILPIFVRPGRGPPERIPSLPGVERRSVDDAVRLAVTAADGGVGAVLFFGLARRKDPEGSEAAADDGPVARAVRGTKSARPDAIVATDVCLCAYTSHGHCGLLRDGQVDNDATLPLLARMAVTHARAGADLVAPSAMMDHQVAAIRSGLDREGFPNTAILAYAAKYASAFYGPFRDAADSAPAVGDRRGYQIDPRNARDALREIALDIEEGADIAMVKPALPYLDVLARARARFDVPLAAYQVSGEYAMIKAAAAQGWVDEPAIVRESLGAIRRAGADLIVTYYAREFASWERGAA